jgi:Zn-dependent protease with chaperone function
MVKPDWLYAWLKHSHPTVHERVQKIEDYEEERKVVQE